ncbi:tyrosine-type recombinase/integrase [Paenibacillus sp.]|uniref:tyrosine-type recombinase/integrase n=1 Tax=Paenibacillus sp. TaxID=58172 RepID=UPI0035C83F54
MSPSPSCPSLILPLEIASPSASIVLVPLFRRDFRLHDLRHSTSRILREDGADMKSIQERLRHTCPETTANICTEESDLVRRETADRFPIRSQRTKLT